jgi:hypothetical protein
MLTGSDIFLMNSAELYLIGLHTSLLFELVFYGIPLGQFDNEHSSSEHMTFVDYFDEAQARNTIC